MCMLAPPIIPTSVDLEFATRVKYKYSSSFACSLSFVFIINIYQFIFRNILLKNDCIYSPRPFLHCFKGKVGILLATSNVIKQCHANIICSSTSVCLMLRVLPPRTAPRSVSGKRRRTTTMKTNCGSTEMATLSTSTVARFLISRAARSNLKVSIDPFISPSCIQLTQFDV